MANLDIKLPEINALLCKDCKKKLRQLVVNKMADEVLK